MTATESGRKPIIQYLHSYPDVVGTVAPTITCQCGWTVQTTGLGWLNLEATAAYWKTHAQKFHWADEYSSNLMHNTLYACVEDCVCTCGERYDTPDGLQKHFRDVDEAAFGCQAEEEESSMTATGSDQLGPVAILREWANALRGDWNVDGRQSRRGLNEIANWIEFPDTYPGAKNARNELGICLTGRGHWDYYCDEDCQGSDNDDSVS